MKDVVMPAVGVAMAEGTLVRWLKQSGDPVVKGDPIAEIETDKADMEVESPVSGRVGRLLVAEGSTVPVGTTLTRILDDSDTEAAADSPDEASVSAAREVRDIPSLQRPTMIDVVPPPAGDVPSPSLPEKRLTPRQRWLAAQSTEGSPADASSDYRRAIASGVVEAWRTIPHFSVTREVDGEAMLAAKVAAQSAGLQVTVTDFLLRALATATGAAGDDANDVGIAVATPKGVVIVVIRNVRALSMAELATVRRDTVQRALTGALTAGDLQGRASTTLSNLGTHGVDHFTGVIALGQRSLLTVGRIRQRLTVLSDQPAVRRTFYATLNVDHRVLDGADAGRLLQAFADAIEGVERGS